MSRLKLIRIRIRCRFLSVFPFLSLILLLLSSHATLGQRLVVSPPQNNLSNSLVNLSGPAKENQAEAQVLKIYPDGTKKIVTLSSLNNRDDGSAFGGPPSLSLYSSTSDANVVASHGLSVAPIGVPSGPVSSAMSLPPSPEPTFAATSAGDPMGGSAPVDPLAGTPPSGSPPPLQTVSGKAAPIVGDPASLQLGVWDGFTFNAGIGGSLQNQLNARRVWNGNNRQAYPYTIPSSQPQSVDGLNFTGVVTGETFNFLPGFRFDTEFGYNFYEWLGVSFQTGVIYNGLQSYTISGDIDQLGGSGDYKFSADGNLIQVPIQINALLRWPGNVPLRPFIGFGLGAVWQQLDVDTVYIGPESPSGDYVRSGFQFGWNAQLGLTYTVEPGLDFYSSCKMLSACMPVIGNYQFQNTYNFAIEVGIQSRF